MDASIFNLQRAQGLLVEGLDAAPQFDEGGSKDGSAFKLNGVSDFRLSGGKVGEAISGNTSRDGNWLFFS